MKHNWIHRPIWSGPFVFCICPAGSFLRGMVYIDVVKNIIFSEFLVHLCSMKWMDRRNWLFLVNYTYTNNLYNTHVSPDETFLLFLLFFFTKKCWCFLISPQKHMLLVLIRSASPFCGEMRIFIWILPLSKAVDLLDILLKNLILVLLNPDTPCLRKQCRSRSVGFWKANWSVSALFIIQYVNLYQQPRSSNLIGWKLEVGMASEFIQHDKG